MPTWSEILDKLASQYLELEVYCPTCKDSARSLALLPRTPPDDVYLLDSCIACMLAHLLDYMTNLPRYYLTSPFGEASVYLLDDAIVELSEESGSVIARSHAEKLIEFLEEMGFDVSSLREQLSNLRRAT